MIIFKSLRPHLANILVWSAKKKLKNLFNPVAKWASRKQGDLP